jgi:hypothetical protein
LITATESSDASAVATRALRAQIDKLASSLKQRDEEVRGLKAEVRVARRAEKAHAQTLAEKAEAAAGASGAAAAAASNSSSSSSSSSSEVAAQDAVATAALLAEKLQLQDLVFDLEVRLEEATDRLGADARAAAAQHKAHQRALVAARQEAATGAAQGGTPAGGTPAGGAAAAGYGGGGGEGGGAEGEASGMPLGFRGAFLADKAAQVRGLRQPPPPSPPQK